MKWITNIGKKELNALTYNDSTFLNGVIVKEPQATAAYTSNELWEMGVRGLYRLEPEIDKSDTPSPD